MSDIPNKDLDAIFKDGSEQHDFVYNEAAWSQMEQMLDTHVEEKKNRRLFFILLFLGGLAISATGYFALSADSNDYSDLQLQNAEIQSQTSNTTIQAEAANLSIETQIFSDTQESEVKESIVASTVKTSTAIDQEDEVYTASSSKTVAANDNNIGDGIDKKDNVKKQTPSKSVEGDLLLPPVANTLPINADASSGPNQSTAVVSEQVHTAAEILNDEIAVDSRALGIIALTSQDLQKVAWSRDQVSLDQQPISAVDLIKKVGNNRWVLTAFAAPEWSSLMNQSTLKLGGRVGLRVGYQFANKWEVSAGAALSLRLMNGSGSEYIEPYDGFFIDDIHPMTMEAKGRFFEVPVQIGYYFNGFRKSGFFTELAINNGAMLSEWYGFDYDPFVDGPQLMHEWQTENPAWQNAASTKLTFGYQKALANGQALQIAPYIQIPLAGIGEGSLDVYGTGLQISYKLSK